MITVQEISSGYFIRSSNSIRFFKTPRWALAWLERQSHEEDCAMRIVDAAECTCGKIDAISALTDQRTS